MRTLAFVTCVTWLAGVAAGSVPLAQPPAGAQTKATIYLVALNDGGKSGKKIGCNDSLVPVTAQVPHSTLATAKARASLEHLLGIRPERYGQSGLHNALHRSMLKVERVDRHNGATTIRLSGTLALGGACDAPRIEAQLTETVRATGLLEVYFLVNDVPLEKALSAQGASAKPGVKP